MIKASLVSFCLKVFQTGALFLSGVVWARLLGVESYGAYAYVWSIVTILSILTLLGTPNFIAREVAASKDFSGARKVVLWSFHRVVISISVILCIASLIWFSGGVSGAHLSEKMLGLLTAALVVNAILRFYESIMRGLHRYILAQLFSSLIGPLILVIVGWYFYWSETDFARNEAVLISLRITVLVAGCLFLYPFFRLNYRVSNFEHSKKWNKSLCQFLIAGVAISANYELATIIVAHLLDLESTGIFNVITRIAAVMSIGIVAISSPVGPKVATEFKLGNMLGVQKLVSKTALYATFFTIPLFLMVTIWGRFLLGVYGQGFVNEDSVLSLRILAAGQLIATMIGPSGVLLVMTKYEKYSSLSVLFSVVVLVLFSFLLVPSHGMVGAALAVCFALVTWKGVMSFWGWKKLGVITLLGGHLIVKNKV